MNKNYKMNNTEWRRLGRSVLLAALLLAALPARAQQYVFLYKNGNTVYFLRNNNGTIQAQANFGSYSSTCIWTGSGTTSSTFINGNYGLYRYQNTLYSLSIDSYTPSTWTITTYGRAHNSNRYIRYSNSSWTSMENNNNPGTNVSHTVLFTYSNHDATLSDPSITGANVLTATGTSDYSVASKAKIQYHQFDGYSGTTETSYYWYNNALQTSAPTETNVTSGTWSLTGNTIDATTYASVHTSTGRITVSSIPPTDLTMTLSCTVTGNGINKTATKTVHLLAENPSAPVISLFGTSQAQITCPSQNVTIYYTTNGNTPTESSTEYSGPFDLNCPSTTVKSIAVRNGHSSTTASITLTCKVPTPVITLTGANATIAAGASSPDGTKLYYTTDGNTPTSSSTEYTGGNITLTNPQTIKVIAIKSGYDNSDIASAEYIIEGVSGSLVILDDRENHNWSYYRDPECPIRSLSPADVKITYYGDGIVMTGNADYTASSTDFVKPGQTNYTGGAKVNVGGENENTFIYFKTLERGDATQTAWTYSTDHSSAASRCPYTTIPNPFQVRPTYGSRGTTDANNFTGWRGFQCWRLKSVSGGAIYSAASGGTALTAGAIINGETQIYFAPNSEYGMDVQLEAVWARAYLVKGNSGNANAILNYGNLGVERNFMTLTDGQSYRFNGTTGRRITNVDRAVTISSYYPNGEAPDGTNNTITGNNNNITLGADTKFENVTLSAGSYTLSGSGHYLIVGRGCANSSIGTVQGLSANSTSNIKFRVESGSYTNLYFMGTYGVTTGTMVATMGSDYDRVKNDNSKLRVTNDIAISNGGTVGSTGTIGTERFTCTVKSGNYYLTSEAPGGGYQFYISSPNGACYGKRTLIVEGGYFADIAGGIDQENVPTSTDMVNIRIKGGEILGAVYGAAQFANAYGNRRIIVTGGDFSGWIAGGANGTRETNGALYGSSYVYVGGDAHIDGSNTVINRAVGGNVFGAGCGYNANSTSGQVTIGTNVVIADDAYIGRGVYGGGSYGYTTQTANMYILGGTIDGKNGGVTGTAYLAAIDGGVYGGACQNKGGTVNLTMNGGTVNGSVYGGSNYTGTLSGTSTVTLNGGTVNGSLYGGGNGEGNPTNVTGAVQVTVNGGTVTGAVYGCGNVSGAPQSTVNVDVYGTDPQPGSGYAINQVFGGGNQANYSGTPVVTVHDDNGCDISIGEVYGGGNAATVTGTNVVIEGGNRIGNVFGGCYGANVTTNGTKVNIKGGTIEHVYGGNNYRGTITGAIKVRVKKDSDCPMKIGELYGGGNEAASNVGSIDIGCTGTYVEGAGGHADCNETDNRIGYELEGIHEVYGGANQANITGDISLTIDSGMVYRVFGGNNNSGSISGTITVNIQKTDPNTCGWYVGYVYGGGFNAPYSKEGTANNPSVNVTNGLVSHSVFGGGKGNSAVVTGNPLVTLSNKAHVGENVYGGGDAAPVTGNTSVILKN